MNRVFGIFLFVVVLVGAGFVQAEDGKAEKAAPDFSSYIHGLAGQNAEDVKNQSFEDLIDELLLVSADDIDRASGRKIDMAARKTYFRGDGWAAYQKYVDAQKAFLARKGLGPDFSYRAKGTVLAGTQVYSDGYNGLKTFTADGAFNCSASSLYDPCGGFHITVSYFGSEKKDVKTNEVEIYIYGWDVRATDQEGSAQ
ncbi:MAG: hypothetical protein KDI13_10770 [Alphaproteobacteria bacterium]|nr:hypothetical protein [Alphaproteobacteria bacterium]